MQEEANIVAKEGLYPYKHMQLKAQISILKWTLNEE